MVTPAFVPYTDTPASPATKVDQNDYGEGDAIETTFNLLNKLGINMGETAQSEETFWNRSVLGSMSVDNLANTVTLNSPPDVGAVVILPGSKYIDIAAYDTDDVLGDPDPRVKQYPFYVGPESSESIQLFKFVASPDQDGLIVQFVDIDPGFGAALTWLNIAPSLPDGSPGVYQSAVDPLFLEPIDGLTTMDNSQLAGDDIFDVADGAELTVGYILIIEPGTVREEQVRCLDVTGDTVTTTPFGFDHAAGSQVFEYLQKVWVQTDIPENAAGGVPTNLNDIATKLLCSLESRI